MNDKDIYKTPFTIRVRIYAFIDENCSQSFFIWLISESHHAKGTRMSIHIETLLRNLIWYTDNIVF